MLTLYTSPMSPYASKVKMCAQALGLEHKEVVVDFIHPAHQPAGFDKASLSGKVPAIDDNGFKLFESNAIMKYLARKCHTSWYPHGDVRMQAKIDQWLAYIAQHLDRHILNLSIKTMTEPSDNVPIEYQPSGNVDDLIKHALDTVNKQLASTAFLAGEQMTLADISLASSGDALRNIGVQVTDFSHIERWQTIIANESWYQSVRKSASQADARVA